jgi:hypothetical protein
MGVGNGKGDEDKGESTKATCHKQLGTLFINHGGQQGFWIKKINDS